MYYSRFLLKNNVIKLYYREGHYIHPCFLYQLTASFIPEYKSN